MTEEARYEKSKRPFLAYFLRWNDFGGFSNRKEFWAAQAWNILWVVVAFDVFGLGLLSPPVAIGLVVVIAWLNLMVSVRRARDIGWNPYFLLTFMIPGVNSVVFLLLGMLRPNLSTKIDQAFENLSHGHPVEKTKAQSVSEQLNEIIRLHEDGRLTDEEFTSAKRKLLED